MTDSVLKFCPVCDSLYNYSNTDKADGSESERLHLVCSSCGHIEDSSSGTVRIHLIHHIKTGVSKFAEPNEITRYEKAFFRTHKVTCVNDKCISHDPSNWSDDGTNMPMVLLYNGVTEDKRMHMLCTVCNTSWRVGHRTVEGDVEEAKEIEEEEEELTGRA